RIQELYLEGHKDEAAAAVPDEWVDIKSLCGPPARIRQRFTPWETCGATSVTVRTAQDPAVDLLAEIARLNPPREA
ncbi:MAG: LLM class F420-dependent oxidoreductase, partial [Alphaproteobacteria bacterium]|nr:LLM class F420-dependent oxidoreductase [Alphaproteobacteria bacterium]